MHHAADHIATARAMYGYLFAETGMRIAEDVRSLAFSSVSGQACAPADLSVMLDGLGRLEEELLDIDGDAWRDAAGARPEPRIPSRNRPAPNCQAGLVPFLPRAPAFAPGR